MIIYQNLILTLILGLLQAGKTTEAINTLMKILNEDTLVLFCTHPFRNVLQDLLLKLKTLYPNCSHINPTEDKKSFDKFLRNLQDNNYTAVPVIALNNDTFHKRIGALLIAAKGKYETHMFLDEFDINQIGFNYKIKQVKRD